LPLLAAVDMGSNSIRLELARIVDGQYRRERYLKETVRLGAGLDARGHLDDAATARGIACLERFAVELRGVPTQHVRAVATQTLREAKNRDAFLERAARALGHEIEVISGREEARLIYAGVSHLQPGRLARLVVDIGGRSTEMILGKGSTAQTVESFAVGSVGLSLAYFADGKLTADAFRAAQVAAGAELEEGLTVFTRARWQEALGSSGTVGAVSQLLQANRITDGEITPRALRWCIERCLEAGHIDKLVLPGLREDRRAVVAGGLALLYTLCVQFDIDVMRPSKGALRQGVIVELDQRVQALEGPRRAARSPSTTDVREATVRTLQRRFDVDAAQARRVSRAAVALLAPHARDADALRDLTWAAELHEIGLMVSHHDHHRHSAYLLSHVDAAGFSQTELRCMASFVLGQRGGLGKMQATLKDEGNVAPLLALRLAVVFCHARTDAPLHAMALEIGEQRARLRLDAGWAREHPRTMHLLAQEVAEWRRATPWRLDVDGVSKD
jgi:exopolyphosphatase / guanosine-5'-triphosphate,3'-diphosphate pyrophosphatase